jgi:hypothetical protein
MQARRLRLTWLGLVAGVLAASASSAAAQTPFAPVPGAEKWDKVRSAQQVPLDQLPPAVRDGVKVTLERPTLFTSGPAEVFACRPAVYYWILEHPDRAVQAWRRLGAKCVSIVDRGAGRFAWTDDQGSEIIWGTVHSGPNQRVWYATGHVRPGPLLPMVPVKACVILRHTEGRDERGGTTIQHQADMFIHTDSAAVAIVSRILGPSAPRMAEQCVQQMQMFFAGLAWYLERHPERADMLLSDAAPAANVQPGQAGH